MMEGVEKNKRKLDPKDECAVCNNPKLPTGDYCEWCQNKIDTYEPDEKEEEDECLVQDE